jgi:hypothetical protein
MADEGLGPKQPEILLRTRREHRRLPGAAEPSSRPHTRDPKLTSRPRRDGSDLSSLLVPEELCSLDVCYSSLAAAVVDLSVKLYALAFDEICHPGAFKRSRMDENITASVGGLDEAIASIFVIEFYYSRCHQGPFISPRMVVLPVVQAHGLEV